MMWRFIAVLLLVCGWPWVAMAEAPWRVSVLYWSDTIAGQLAMREGLRRHFKVHNRRAAAGEGRTVLLEEHVAGDGEDGVDRQIRQFYQALEQRPDLIIVQPTDSAALAEPLMQANRLGIPVLAYDQYIEGGRLAGLVASDNYQAGYLAGEVIAAAMPDDRPLRLILVDYPTVSSTVLRTDGFLDALEALNQPYRLLHSYQAVEPMAGRAAARSILRDYPEPGSVDVIFTVNDGGGLALRETLIRAGRKDIRLASVDGDPAQVEAIADDDALLLVDVAQLCAVLGEHTARVGLQLLRGEGQGRLYRVPVYPVTHTTLSGYTGWYGRMPAPFTKPWISRQPYWNNRIQTMPLPAP